MKWPYRNSWSPPRVRQVGVATWMSAADLRRLLAVCPPPYDWQDDPDMADQP